MEHFSFLGFEIDLLFEFNTKLPSQENYNTANDNFLSEWLRQKIRYYKARVELKKGGRAVALQGCFADENGGIIENRQNVVLKVPNINEKRYTFEQIKDYLTRLDEEGGKEWQLTRKRLHNCKFANPIFDFTSFKIPYLGELVPFPITAQFFLDDAKSLDDYLLFIGQRTEPYKAEQDDSDSRQMYDNWKGMTDHVKWLELSRSIALGLADIHQRRVVHGDIWPPNIFIRQDSDGAPYPIFIDFGEAFPIEPSSIPKNQRDHAYRAPERKDAQSIVTQLADVYSFGKLLLHLAIGEEPILSANYRGHERRDLIRNKFEQRQNALVRYNPYIIDIICKCVSLDPADRPSMNEVSRALNSYIDTKKIYHSIPNIPVQLNLINELWGKLKTDLDSQNKSIGPPLEELVEQKIYELNELIKGLTHDAINLNETRERLIIYLLSLFKRLGEGDRYISITHPRMWQGSALGLDGRYFTATQLAAKNGASIQRVFIFSVHEVGQQWAQAWEDELQKFYKESKFIPAKILAESIHEKIKKYSGAVSEGLRELPVDLQIEAQKRLRLIVKSYADAGKGICQNKFELSERFTLSQNCRGIYLGLYPEATLKDIRLLKSKHPVSVFFYSKEDIRDQYLLMMTDCIGRDSYGINDDNPDKEIAYQKAKPELRGISVFKSVNGVPNDRIKMLEGIFVQSANIGARIDDILNTFPSIQGDK